MAKPRVQELRHRAYLSPELPVPVETAACFLAYLADAGRIDRTTGERTRSGDPIRHGYLRQAIAAIGYRHELNGPPSPLHDPLITSVRRGCGRIHDTDSRAKDPIRLDGLTWIGATLTRPQKTAVRHRAMPPQQPAGPTATVVEGGGLVNLYWGAFRGSELVAMTWADTRTVDQGVEWTVRRSKNDQLGRSEVVGAAPNLNPISCPAAPLAAWHGAATERLGQPPRPDDPVFIRLNRLGDAPAALSREGVSDLVKRATRAAKLTGDYASHSLRDGFVSDALDNGATREQVQHHGRWAALKRIGPYYRKNRVWGPHNPSARLSGAPQE